MNTGIDSISRYAFALAMVATALLVCAMVTLPICKEQVFLERGAVSNGGEMLILIGFLSVPIFNIVSLGWVIVSVLRNRLVRKGDLGTMGLNFLCLILLMADKVMLDEIGREYPLGWNVGGEWIMLYAFLTVQVFYNLLILRRLRHTCRGAGAEVQA